MKATKETPKVRELFIEEMVQVQAGSASSGPGATTYACCEEGPFGCCEILPIDPGDILRP
jgi:hypothetical protein